MAASSLGGEIDSMGDLSLGAAAGQYADADSDDSQDEAMPVAPAPSNSTYTDSALPQKKKRSAAKSLYKPWARNLLTQAELLDLASGLPKGFESEWLLKVVPEGRR